MTKALQEKLIKDFPLLYRMCKLTPMKSCMGRGLEIGDGWEPLLRKLSAKLESLIKKQKGSRASFAQVKEKFALLTIYMDNSTEEMDSLVSEAENDSAKICEDCGKSGKLRKGAWYRTLCDTCHKRPKHNDDGQPIDKNGKIV